MTTIFSLHRAGDGFNKNIREEKTGKSRHTFRAYTCNCPRFFDIYLYNIFRKKLIDKSKTPMTALFRAS